jgi:hypothetical protein
MKTLVLTGAFAISTLGALACSDGVPTSASRDAVAVALSQSDVTTDATGMTKVPIGGTIRFAGQEPPLRRVVTPAGVCHAWDLSVFTQLTGDVAGPVAFREQSHDPQCDLGHLVVSGPFEGEVIWNGRSGTISGMFTSNCTPDATQPLGTSCGGTMNARGAGGLEGVQFHFKWGPGWYPFVYTGTAFSK